jgi:adenylylsulfate kinase
MSNPNTTSPASDLIMGRKSKEKLLNQNAKVIWLTGLSGAGKTTIAKNLERELYKRGYFTQILDGDIIRSGINNNLNFTDADRMENIRRIAEVAKLLVNNGIITISSFISPTNEIRNMTRTIIGTDNLIEIFVNAPIEICEERDVKGLYKKARSGEIKNFTGIDSPFEYPVNPDIELKTHLYTIEESIQQCLEIILPEIEFKK